MAEDTKTCTLFESEIKTLIHHHANNVAGDISGRLDRMNYLHKRLKAFKEEAQPAPANNEAQQAAATAPATDGWR